MFKSIGILKYAIVDLDPPYKLSLEIDKNISRYYFSLIPKHIRLQSQMYAPHISVVRKETPINLDVWGKYDGEEIEFEYDNYVYNDNTYYWLNVFSDRLEKIRVELGLPVVSGITKSPDGKHKFHTTIGNIKAKPYLRQDE
jgi:hypothetical protein